MGGSSLGRVLLNLHTECYLICMLYPGASQDEKKGYESGQLGASPEITCGKE